MTKETRDAADFRQNAHRDALLRMRSIVKTFPGVRALQGVDLTLRHGEILAVVGENGAGKSTLIKVLAGVHTPDEGQIELDGERAAFRSPLEAQRAGISVIYQEFNLVPTLTVRENVMLGRENARAGFVSRAEEHRQVEKVFERMRVSIPLEARCGSLSVAEQQLVEIARSLNVGSRILVMDEPTAALSEKEVATLFDIVQDLRREGMGIIYISHRLSEVFAVADRVMVLRDGRHIDTRSAASVTRAELIEMMVGRSLEQEFPPASNTPGAPRLEVIRLCRGQRVREVSFEIRKGEILGLTGLVGAGRTEVARLLFGADRAESGTIRLDGRELRLREPIDAIRAGISLLTEDRKAEGLVLGLSSRENFALPNLGAFSRYGFVDRTRERRAFSSQVDRLQIRLSHQDQPARDLSGGNQQKVLLARWLEANAEVVIFDEPTRGIDVGAKYEIYLLMNELAAAGKAILMISSELPEVLGMSHRILVMHEGRISGEINDVPAATQERIMALAMGKHGL